MLGVTRIYSRKVQYLLDDCRETRERITLVSHGFGRGYNLSSDAMMGELRADITFQAFRPGIVDLPEDQIRASKNAITLPDARNDFDFFDWSVPSLMSSGHGPHLPPTSLLEACTPLHPHRSTFVPPVENMAPTTSVAPLRPPSMAIPPPLDTPHTILKRAVILIARIFREST